MYTFVYACIYRSDLHGRTIHIARQMCTGIKAQPVSYTELWPDISILVPLYTHCTVPCFLMLNYSVRTPKTVAIWAAVHELPQTLLSPLVSCLVSFGRSRLFGSFLAAQSSACRYIEVSTKILVAASIMQWLAAAICTLYRRMHLTRRLHTTHVRTHHHLSWVNFGTAEC